MSDTAPSPTPITLDSPTADATAAPEANARGPRILALMNQKGGVGKTTTTVNLGAGLARLGRRVLMIDLDPQAHLSLHLGIDPDTLDKSMYDLLSDHDTTAAQTVQQINRNLGLLPAEVNLAGIESELADKAATGFAQTVLRNKTRDLVQQFDDVLIDCPPSLGLLTINALTVAREVIVPMQAHFLALQGLGKLFETIQMIRQGVNPDLLVAGVVLCMHERQTLLANEVMSDLSGFLEQARGTEAPWRDAIVFQPPIRRNIKLAEAPSFGQAIFDYDPTCHGAADYGQLAQSVAAHRVGL